MGSLEPVLGSLAPTVNMLLWLCLLLSTGTCGVMHGMRSPGTYFETPVDKNKDITGMEFQFNSVGLITGLRLRIGSTWSGLYCKQGQSVQKVELRPNEYVSKVYGENKLYIQRLVFSTTQGREIPFGFKSGTRFDDWYGDDSGKVLTSICGKCFYMGIAEICFKWDFPLERSIRPAN